MQITTVTQKTVTLGATEVATSAGLDSPEQWSFPVGITDVSFTVERTEP